MGPGWLVSRSRVSIVVRLCCGVGTGLVVGVGRKKSATSCTYFNKSSTFIEFSKAKRKNYAHVHHSDSVGWVQDAVVKVVRIFEGIRKAMCRM